MTTETEKVAPYWWFQGTAVRELVERLTEAGPDSARLEVRLDGNKMTFRVVPADTGKNGTTDTHDINDSRLCPPICPE